MLQLATELVVSLFLCVVLLFINWQMTVFIVVIFLILTAINSRFLKPRLNKVGKKNQDIQSTDRKMENPGDLRSEGCQGAEPSGLLYP